MSLRRLVAHAPAGGARRRQRAGRQNPPAPPAADDADLDPNVSQPDFTLVNLPTTLRLPRIKSAFRVTHRFLRPLGQDDFGDRWSEDLFGLDSGAIIGLEYRFGLMSGLQAGILRTSDRDDRVLRAVQRAEPENRRRGRSRRARVCRWHEQLPRHLLTGDWPGDFTRAGRPRRRLRRAGLGQQLESRSTCPAKTTRRSWSGSARGCASVRRSI